MSVLAVDVFRKGGKTTYNKFFPGRTAFAVLFYYLAAALLCHYNKPVLGLILKPVVE